MNRRRRVALVTLLGIVSACSSTQAASPLPSPAVASAAPTADSTATSQAVELTVYAAASLRDVLAEVRTAYETVFPGTTLTLATDSSSALRTQIEQGAPADVFLSADRNNAQSLVDAGLADGAAVDFAGNLLTIIVPTANPAAIATAADLARPGVKIIAAGDAVPIARYAQQTIDNLAALPGYPADFAQAYAANIVSREENVKAVVAKIELGEGDAAIVYVTDAMPSTKVEPIDIPAAANVSATYAGIVVRASTRAAAAHRFLDWLAGPDGAAILARFGFQAPS